MSPIFILLIFFWKKIFHQMQKAKRLIECDGSFKFDNEIFKL